MGVRRLIPKYYIWYCKCRKSQGTPIAVYNPETKKIRWCSKLPSYIAKKPVRIEMAFNNSIPIAKQSGATTILEVYEI